MLKRIRYQIQQNKFFGKLYEDFMKEYEALEHMTLTSPSKYHNQTVFLPHHGVLRENSTTTKLRVVFNGSLRTTSGISLNDCVREGRDIKRETRR